MSRMTVLAAGMVALGSVGVADAAGQADSPAVAHPVVVDLDLSPVAGTGTLLSAAAGIYWLEDRLLPVALGAEDGVAAKAGGMAYRLVRLALLDGPLEVFQTVVRHEIAGHGGRIRPLGGDVLEYRLELPPPFGDGGGAVVFEFEEIHPTERALVSAAGLEAASLAMVALEERWTRRGRMDFREGLHYLMAALETIGYVEDARGGPPREGHDVEGYLAAVNAAGPEGAVPLGTSDLAGVQIAEFLLSPQLFWSLNAVFRSFLAGGNADAPVPALSVAGARVMPRAHLRLGPFGPEWAVGAVGFDGSRAAWLDLRWGDGPHGSFGGVDLGLDRVWHRPGLTLDGRLSLWRHFAVEGGRVGEARVGALGAATARISLGGSGIDGLLELGLKSDGYVPGETLESGVILRAGAVVPGGLLRR